MPVKIEKPIIMQTYKYIFSLSSVIDYFCTLFCVIIKILNIKKGSNFSMKFLKSVGQEMKMVTWPTFKQNRHDTLTVVTSSILFAAYLGALDWLFSMVAEHL